MYVCGAASILWYNIKNQHFMGYYLSKHTVWDSDKEAFGTSIGEDSKTGKYFATAWGSSIAESKKRANKLLALLYGSEMKESAELKSPKNE